MKKPTLTSKGHGLARMSLWALAGNGVYMVSQLGVVVAIAQLTSAEDLGRYGFSMAVATPVLVFFNFSLRLVQATDTADRFSFSVYFSLRILTTLTAFVLLTLCVAIVSDSVTKRVFIAVIVMKAIESFSDLCAGAFQKHERTDLIARSLMLRGPITLLIFAGILYEFRSLPLAMLAQVLVWTLVVALHDFRTLSHLLSPHEAIAPRYAKASLLSLLQLSFPLGLASLLASLVNNAPRLIIELVLGLAALGIFTALSYVLTAGLFFANAMGHILSARLARLEARGQKRAFWNMVTWAAIVAACVGLLSVASGWVIGRPILAIAFGAEYALYTPEFTIILGVLAVRLLAVIAQTGLAAQQRFRWLSLLQGISFVLTLTLAGAGAIKGGLFGLTIGLLAAAVIQLALLLIVLVYRPR